MDNIKIGSIVRCNAQALTCYGLNGLVYKLNHYAIATVAFSGEKQTRVIPVDLLTLVGEIEPGCMALNYRPGCQVKRSVGDRIFDEAYIVDHIEISQPLRSTNKDTLYYRVYVTDMNDNLRNLYPDDKIYNCLVVDPCNDPNWKEENGMCMSKAKDTRVPTKPTEIEITYDDVAKYRQNGISITKQAAKVLLNSIYDVHSKTLKEEIQMKAPSKSGCNPIKKVIFNDPATIVFWKDGTKTIVKCQEGAEFDPEKGLAMAISRHYLCDICGLERYDGVFKRYAPKEEKK